MRQCAGTLRRLVPQATLQDSVDGAHAAASLPAGCAALASPRVAARHGLTVLAEAVCDNADNATTFQLLAPRLDQTHER